MGNGRIFRRTLPPGHKPGALVDDMEENQTTAEQAAAPKKGGSSARPVRRATIPGMQYATIDGEKRAIVDDRDARLLASRKVSVTLLSPQTRAAADMLRFADIALQRLQSDLSLVSDPAKRRKIRDTISSFEDKQFEFIEAINELIAASGVSISTYLQRRIDAANADSEEPKEAEKPVQKPAANGLV